MEARGGGEDAPGWLLLYVIVAPQGSGSSDAAAATAAAVDAQGKIFWWLCADFYAKTPGDRCSLVSLYVDGPAPARGGDPKGSVRKLNILFVSILYTSTYVYLLSIWLLACVPFFTDLILDLGVPTQRQWHVFFPPIAFPLLLSAVVHVLLLNSEVGSRGVGASLLGYLGVDVFV